MRTLTRRTAVAITLAIALVVSLMPALAGAAAPADPTLVEIRAAHYPGYDRIVFEFSGGLPDVTRARWVDRLRKDPSNKPAKVQGNAFIRVLFRQAVAHDDGGQPTVSPLRRAYDLPNIAHVAVIGDYEGYVSVGIGLMERTKIRKTYRLSGPARFVVDVNTGFPKKRVPVFFVDDDKVVSGDPVVVSPVKRWVRKLDPKRGALQRLYAGPTEQEKADRLRFISSRTYGFKRLRTNRFGVTRVQLRGQCNSMGSAVVTVADEIRATLMALPAVKWVKIYGPDGTTIWPTGRRHSDPYCLQP
jgi:hypothetical protein